MPHDTDIASLAAIALVGAAAFVLGSVNSALILARRAGVDLRSVGSGNPGATNAGRALGRQTGRIVLVLDAAKGAAAVLLARVVASPASLLLTVAIAGLAVVAGHCFPVFHGFRGGKGAATTLGVMLAAVPIAGALGLLIFVVVRKVTGRVSVGSLTGTLGGALLVVFVDDAGAHVPPACLVGTVGADEVVASGWSALSALGLSLLALVTVRHRANLGRLLRGEEPRT